MRNSFHRVALGIVVFSLVMILGGCGMTHDMNTVKHSAVNTMSRADVLYKKQYAVTGQVLDTMGNPVQDCGVYLVKRKINPFEKGTQPDKSENILSGRQITDTDGQGQYYLTFTPGQSNDIWLAFTDSKERYKARWVRLNQKLGNTLLEYPGVSPVFVDVVLEP